MGIGYICKSNLKLAVVVWDGIVAWDDWQKHLQRMFTDPAYAPMKIQITDLHYVSISTTISKEQIQVMTDMLTRQRESLSLEKIAIIAGDEWDKSQLVQIALRDISVNSIVFNELATACLWLGVNASEVEQDIKQVLMKLRQNH